MGEQVSACPTCGSTSQFVVRGQCASDVRDPDEWHTHTIRKMGEQVSERVAMAVFHDHETGQVRIGPADGSPLDINDALALVNAARVVPSAGDVAPSLRGFEPSEYEGIEPLMSAWRARAAGAVLALFASQPTVAQVREQVAREIEAAGHDDDHWLRTCDDYRENGWEGDPDDYERMFWAAAHNDAARIARTETKGGE